MSKTNIFILNRTVRESPLGHSSYRALCAKIPSMDAIDRIEALLGASEAPRADHVNHLSASIVEVCELAAIRWGMWRDEGKDLLTGLPADPPGSMLEGAARRSTGIALLDLLEQSGPAQIAQYDSVHLCEIPVDSAGWEPGGSVSLFEEALKDTLVQAGYATAFAHGLAGALHEIASNASEHSNPPIPPLAAFSVRGSAWGVAVVDVGRGARLSLADNPALPPVADDLQALKLALSPGISRTGELGRGFGFRHIFKALVDRSCHLRIRTGAALALWSGATPTDQDLHWRKTYARHGFQVGICGHGSLPARPTPRP